jgi:hypothetical protein
MGFSVSAAWRCRHYGLLVRCQLRAQLASQSVEEGIAVLCAQRLVLEGDEQT